MKFNLPTLNYSKDAFKNFITEEGFDYHYGKHHQTYITNLNKLIENSEWENYNLDTIIKDAYIKNQMAIYNNAAQHYNHSFFWNCITPNSTEMPSKQLLELLIRDFGSLEAFKEEFSNTATKLFGAGWTWLVLTPERKLEILALSNADTPIIFNKKPLLTIDVWEHAYYIDHRNARPKFIEQFWNHVNWNFVSQNLE